MFRSIALALLVLASLAVPACAQQAPAAQTKRWTNADMDGLRERGLISIVGQEAPAHSEPSRGRVGVQQGRRRASSPR